MKSLEALMKAHITDGGIIVDGDGGMHMELREKATGTLWMSLSPVSPEQFKNIDHGEEFEPFGIATASMDSAGFQHSPNAEGEPVRQRVIDGLRFVNNAEAISLQFPENPEAMAEASVNKAHVVGFKAGRTLSVLRLAEGDFIEVIGNAEKDNSLVLPEGARIDTVVLEQPLVIELPNPTRTLWRLGEDPRSFQGPVSLPISLQRQES